MRKEWLSGLVVLMMWSGCTPITGEIDASSYDNSCLLNGDCVTIREGDACDECGCDNAAINRRDRSLYERDYERASNTCASSVGGVQCGACQAGRTVCVDNTCEFLPQTFFYTDSRERSCETVEDCALVPVGDPCSVCLCDQGAISAIARESYMEEFEAVECGVREEACAADCAQPELACQDGMCVVQ
jgi:hypothetical protein